MTGHAAILRDMKVSFKAELHNWLADGPRQRFMAPSRDGVKIGDGEPTALHGRHDADHRTH
jgi:hypothetical protein